MSVNQRLTDKKQQRELLLKRVAEAKRRYDLYGFGTDYLLILNGLEGLEPKFSYAPHQWIRAAEIAYGHSIKIEDLAQWCDGEILREPNIGRKTLRWIRENYPADYVGSQ
jgi:hypothetical protein